LKPSEVLGLNIDGDREVSATLEENGISIFSIIDS
jgi:hypothetical protein